MKDTKKFSKKALILALSAFVAMFAFAGCSDEEKTKEEVTDSATETTDNAENSENEEPQIVEPKIEDYSFLEGIDTSDATKVNVEMSDGQTFIMEIYPHVAPKSAENFLNLVKEGFYDGLTFHRVIDGFMAQGGDPDGTGMGGSDKTIEGEFSQNGFENPLPHMRGVVSMARSQDPNSASSQFFICYDDATFLDGQYASFGCVTEGMNVVDSFLLSGTDSNDKPLKEVKIKKMTIAQ